MITALTWEQDTEPNYAIINRLSKLLKDELLALPGTQKVAKFGIPQEEIAVEINPTQLASLGLTAQQLSAQIQQSDAKVSSGQFRSPNNDLLLEVDSNLDSLNRIGIFQLALVIKVNLLDLVTLLKSEKQLLNHRMNLH